MRTYRLILSLLLTAPLCINVAAQELHDKAWSVLSEGGALWMGSEMPQAFLSMLPPNSTSSMPTFLMNVGITA